MLPLPTNLWANFGTPFGMSCLTVFPDMVLNNEYLTSRKEEIGDVYKKALTRSKVDVEIDHQNESCVAFF